MASNLAVDFKSQTETEALEEILSAAGEEEEAISLEEFLRREGGEV